MKLPRILSEFLDRPWWSVALHIAPFLLSAIFVLVAGYDGQLRGFPVANIVLFVMIYAVMALGLNVVLGYTGLLDLGYVTFLATGAVVTCILLGATPLDDMGAYSLFTFVNGYPFIILASGLVCALLGVLRGLPTLRLTGDYYAIVTLGLAEIFYLIFKNEDNWTGGAFAVRLEQSVLPTMTGRMDGAPRGKPLEFLYWDSAPFYWLVLAVLLMTIYVMYRLHNSRLGRAWAAIRLDETAARTCGIHIGRYKMIAFAISGFFGGVGGSLFAVWLGTVAVNNLDIWQSILILSAVVLGGTGSIRGVLFGSLVLFSLREVLREKIGGLRIPPEASNLVYGLILVYIMRFRPEGILPRKSGEREPTEDEEKAMRSAPARLYKLREPTKRPEDESLADAPVVLALEGLCRYFGGVKAVEKIDVQVREGLITSLIGPNGAGKTTVFNTVTGIFPPTTGKILFTPEPDGTTHDVSRTRTASICELGIARTFQNIRLFTDLPVLENVKVGLHCRTQANVFGAVLTLPAANREEEEVNRAAIHYLDFVGLFDKANDVASNLAYGDQRRLEIARALATQPRLLLLDEPAAGMNPQETEGLMALIHKIRRAGTTVFLIEHDMKLVMEISDQIYVMDHGSLICEGPPETVRNDPKVIEAYLGVDDEEEGS